MDLGNGVEEVFRNEVGMLISQHSCRSKPKQTTKQIISVVQMN